MTSRFWGTGVLIAALLSIPAPLAAFEVDFHYYAVYIVLRAKGYPQIEAARLAGLSQFVDDNPATEPLLVSEETRQKFHFAGSSAGQATTRNEVVARQLVIDSFQKYAPGTAAGAYLPGQALHLLADTFSHEAFTAWRNREINCQGRYTTPCIGHSNTPELGHAPDRPYNDVDRALEAAKAIYDTVAAGPTPGRRWSAIEGELRSALTQTGAPADRLIAARIRKMRQASGRLFEDTEYDKTAFAGETPMFNAAVGATLKNWKRVASWRPSWW